MDQTGQVKPTDMPEEQSGSIITDFEHLIKTHVKSIEELKAKRRELSSEIKEKQLALSDYLIEYKRMTEANQLSLLDGSVVDIVVTAKVAKKPKN